jgi:hypothetical protein
MPTHYLFIYIVAIKGVHILDLNGVFPPVLMVLEEGEEHFQ